MRLGEHDEDYIWLRQSATFVVNGQTRTVEIAIPVRRGCTPEELESLLDEADAGMARLSRHLDARIAEQTGTVPSPAAMPAVPSPRVPAPPPTEPAPHPAPPVASPPPTPTATRAAAPSPTIAERPTAQRTSPPATPPQRPTPPAPAAPAAPATSGAPLTIPEFIAAISAEFGYNARQAMEELGVRTLSGLNLREALETLRRKHLRAGGPPTSDAPIDTPPAPPAPARSAPPSTTPTRPAVAPPAPPMPAPIGSAHYFEEEEDGEEYTFDLEDEDSFAPTAPGHAPAAPLGAFGEDEPPLPDEDEFDLAGELPDFDALPPPPEAPAPPPTRPRATPTPRPAPSRATSAAPSVASTFAAPPTSVPTTGPLAGAEHMRGLPRLGQLRAIPVGGAATPYQRKAYHNLVISQLGEDATTLVAGVWRATPAQLGADQLEALIRWAKEDAFYDEAQQVLAALTAERARAAAANGATNAGEEASGAPPSANGRASASGPAPRRAASPRSRDTTRDAEGGR